jgi:hypothetical protein
MRCAFCGHEFSEEEAIQGCGGCPVGKGCQMLKCPRCNYEIPAEPAWIKKLKKLLGRVAEWRHRRKV